MRRFFFSVVSLVCCYNYSQAATPDTNTQAGHQTDTQTLTQCLQSTVATADESMTISELKQACQQLPNQHSTSTLQLEEKQILKEQIDEAQSTQLLKKRMTMEALNRANRFILTPHKRNYFFPISYNNKPNSEPYETEDDPGGLANLSQAEAELQLSIKILLRENIFGDNGHFYLGYTNHSLWQLYNDKDSAPFRATDHQPEFMLSFTNDWEFWGFRNALNEVILNHQSNGQGGLLSRSWNRIMFNSVFEKGNFVFAITPWYRIPEKAQDYPGDPHGDDNPDITHYMGNFSFTGAYQNDDSIYSIMLRNNLKDDNKGAVELGWSFPLSSNLRGHVKYFSGYGHSLIDYDKHLNVAGFGVVFTDLF